MNWSTWAPAVTPLIGAVGRTWRLREEGEVHLSPFRKPPSPIIYASWHSRLLPSFVMYRHRRIHILVSPSRDGEVVTGILKKMGFGAVRGSTRQGPVGAIRGMVDVLKEGFDVAMTVDGPLGPRERVQPGVVYIAKQSGCPIVPYSFDCASKWELKSWDRMMIPKPFTRGVFTLGKPVRVPEGASDTTMESLRGALEQELHRLTAQAARSVSA